MICIRHIFAYIERFKLFHLYKWWESYRAFGFIINKIHFLKNTTRRKWSFFYYKNNYFWVECGHFAIGANLETHGCRGQVVLGTVVVKDNGVVSMYSSWNFIDVVFLRDCWFGIHCYINTILKKSIESL